MVFNGNDDVGVMWNLSGKVPGGFGDNNKSFKDIFIWNRKENSIKGAVSSIKALELTRLKDF